MAVQLGVFVVPDAQDPERTLAQIAAADELGLDLVGVQDHPYQRRFLDTWTLLAFAAARPDLLSGGRVELGLGAGAFWDGIAAMGGPRRSGPESVDALIEAIAVLRGFWSGERAVTVRGQYYAVGGVHPGPAPAHPIGIWLGAYGPRMVALTGRLADGWLPSVPRLPLDDVLSRQEAIDEAARRAGRDPGEIVRACNLSLSGDPAGWPDQVVRLAADYRFGAFFLGADGDDPLDVVRRIGEETAPRVRDALGAAR